MNVTTGARRITPAVSRERAGGVERQVPVDPVLGATFISVCAAVLLAALIMAALLAMRVGRPVPAYAVFGSGLFGAVFGSFLVGALHLAVTDSRRNLDDH